MDQILSEFIAETKEFLSDIDDCLVIIKNDINDQEAISSALKALHTIKGSSGFLDVPRLTKLSHYCEEALLAINELNDNDSSTHLSAVSECITILYDLLELINTNNGNEPAGNDIVILDKLAHVISLSQNQTNRDKNKANINSKLLKDNVDKNSSSNKGINSIRVKLELVDSMVNTLSELITSRNKLKTNWEKSDPYIRESAFRELFKCTNKIKEQVLQLSMEPISAALKRIPMIIKKLEDKLEKKIRLQITGADLELDRRLVEALIDPLVHLVRNSADHGIETSQERIKRGKPEFGTIKINVSNRYGQVILTLEDDGKGLDPQQIIKVAIRNGYISQEKAQQMSEKEIFDLTMTDRFSSKEEVTTISGRGIGLNFVRSKIESMGGNIEIQSTLGQRCAFILKMPTTVSISSVLIVKVKEYNLGIPIANILEIVGNRKWKNRIKTIHGLLYLEIRNQIIPIQPLKNELTLESNITSIPNNSLIILIESNIQPYGIIVDDVENIEELVTMKNSKALGTGALFSGHAILGNNQVILILNPDSLSVNVKFKHTKNSIQNRHTDILNQKETMLKRYLIIERSFAMSYAIPLEQIKQIRVCSQNEITNIFNQLSCKIDNTMLPVIILDRSIIKNDTEKQDMKLVIIEHQGYKIAFPVGPKIRIEELIVQKNSYKINGLLDLKTINKTDVAILDICYLAKNVYEHNFDPNDKNRNYKIQLVGSSEIVHTLMSKLKSKNIPFEWQANLNGLPTAKINHSIWVLIDDQFSNLTKNLFLLKQISGIPKECLITYTNSNKIPSNISKFKPQELDKMVSYIIEKINTLKPSNILLKKHFLSAK